MSDTEFTSDVAALTVQLLSAYLSNNTVASEDIAGLIRSTRQALTAETAANPVEPEAETFTPAVSARKSLASPEHIISLIDGKPYRTLKRHLTANGLTPEDYRARYNLPATYPMVAPAYSAHRRDVAQKIGLGSRKLQAAAPQADDVVSAEDPVGAEALEIAAAPEAKKRRQKSAPAKAKAPARKSKIVDPGANTGEDLTLSVASEPAAAEIPTDAKPASATSASDAIVEPKARRAPAESKAKRQPSKALKGEASKSDAVLSASVEAPAGEEVAPMDQAIGGNNKLVEAKPKRRGKIGLFGKKDGEAEARSKDADQSGATPVATAESEGISEGRSPSKAAAKPGRPKRMARTPQPSTSASAGPKGKFGK